MQHRDAPQQLLAPQQTLLAPQQTNLGPALDKPNEAPAAVCETGVLEAALDSNQVKQEPQPQGPAVLPHTPVKGQDTDPAAAAAAAGLNSLSIEQLERSLQDAGTYPADMLASMMAALRRRAQLLFGESCDTSAVQAADVCRAWQAIEADLQQRLQQGGSQEQQQLQLRSARNVVKVLRSILSVLVEQGAMIEGEQAQLRRAYKQVWKRLSATATAAAPEAAAAGAAPEAEHVAAGLDTTATVKVEPLPTAAEAATAATSANAATPTPPDNAQLQQQLEPQHGDQQQQQPQLQQHAPHGSITLGEVLEQWRQSGFCTHDALMTKRSALRLHALAVHGPGCTWDAVQAVQLCRQWARIEEHLVQRVQGSVNGQPLLQPQSAARKFFVLGSLLKWLAEQGHVGTGEQQQLKQQYKAAHRRLAGTSGDDAAAASGAAGPAALDAEQGRSELDMSATPSATAPAARSALLHHQQQQVQQHPQQQQLQIPQALSPESSISLTAVFERWQQSREASEAGLRNRRSALTGHAQLLYGPDVDLASVPALELCRQTDRIAEHLLQRVRGPVGEKPRLQPNSALILLGMLNVLLKWLCEQGRGGSAEQQQQLRQRYLKARRWLSAAAGAEAGEGDDDASGNAAADSGAAAAAGTLQQQQHQQAPQPQSSISLAAVFEQWQQADEASEAALQPRRSVLTMHAQLVYGPDADLAVVPALELCRQVDRIAEHLLQRVRGPVGGTPRIKDKSARNMLSTLSTLRAWLCEHGHGGSAEQQQQLTQQHSEACRRLAAGIAAAAGAGDCGNDDGDHDTAAADSGTASDADADGSPGAEGNTTAAAVAAAAHTWHQLQQQAPHAPCGPTSSSITLAQVCEQWQQSHAVSMHVLQNRRSCLRTQAQQLYGPGSDPDAVPAVELCRQVDSYADHLVQRLHGPVDSQSQLQPRSAQRMISMTGMLLKWLCENGHGGSDEQQQQLRQQYLDARTRLAAATPAAAAADGGSDSQTDDEGQSSDEGGISSPPPAAATAAAAAAAAARASGSAASRARKLHKKESHAKSGPTSQHTAARGAAAGRPQLSSPRPQQPASATPSQSTPVAPVAAVNNLRHSPLAASPAGTSAAPTSSNTPLGTALLAQSAAVGAAAAAAGAHGIDALRLHRQAAPKAPPVNAGDTGVAGHSRSFIAAEIWLYDLLPLLNTNQGLQLSLRRGMRLLEGLPTADVKLFHFWRDYRALLMDLDLLLDPAAPGLQQEEVVSSLRTLANNALNETVGHA